MTRRRRFLLLIAAFVLLVVVAAALLLGTRWGLQRIVGLADGAGGARIAAEVERGSVLGGFVLADIAVDAGGTEVRLDRLRVSWRPGRLLGGELAIEAIEAGKLLVVPAPAADDDAPAAPPSPPSLPFDVSLGSLRLEALTIGAGEAPLAQDLAVTGGLVDDVLTIETLSVDLTPGRLVLDGQIGLDDPWPHDLSVRLTGSPDAPLADLVLDLAGDASRTRLQASSEDHGATLEATATGLAGTPAWEARLTLREGRLAPRPESAILEARGSLDAALLEGHAVVDGRRIELRELALEREGDAVRIGTLRAAVPSAGLALDASGRADASLAGEFAGTLRVTRQDLRSTIGFELAGDPGSFEGRIDGQIVGQVAGQADRQSGGLAGLGSGTIPVQAAFRGSPERIELTAASARLGDESVTASGEVTLAEPPRWRLSLRATDVDPGRLQPGFDGNVTLALSGSGEGDAWRMTLEELAGTLRGRELDGGGRLAGRGTRVDDADLTLRSGDARLRAVGQWIGDLPTGEATLDISDLADLVPDATGRIAFRAEADDSGIELTGQAGEVTAGPVSIDGARLTGSVDPREPRTAQAVLTAKGLTASGVAIEEATIELAGWLDDARATFEVVMTELGRVTGDAAYAADGAGESLRLGALTIDVDDLGAWTLESPLVIEREGDAIRVDRSCLTGVGGRLCLAADLVPGEPGTVAVELAAVPLRLVEPAVAAAIGEPLQLSGTLRGELLGTTSGLSWTGVEARVEGDGITVGAPHRLAETTLAVDRLLVAAEGDASSVSFRLDSSTSAGDVGADGVLDDPLTSLRALRDTSARVAIDDLAQLRPLIPALPGLAGRADLTLRASGPLPRPDLEGELEVAELAFEVPRQGVRVAGGTLTAAIDAGGAIELEGALPFDEGVLQLTGTGRWTTDAAPELRIEARGDMLRLADSPELYVVASPDVTAQLDGDVMKLRGRVRIEEAEIRTPSAGTVVRPSGDVVLVGTDDEAESAMERGLDVDIRIELADEDVRFVGFGMEAELGGALEIVDRPGIPTLATGEIEVAGKYEAWGQELEIESGRIIYAGTPITNPALLLEAVRVVDGKRVGVRVTGPVRQPEVEVFSDPAMESSRALSLLLLGRPLEDTTSNESDQLATAALAMAVRGSGRFAGALGSQLGFSEFGLTVRDDLGGAAFSIGRQLSSRLYLQYSIGLADALDLITLRYRLGDHWSLETEIGEETRGAIRYEVETGRGSDG